MPVVKELGVKIDRLCSSHRHPAISRREDLARELGIVVSNISQWINGSAAAKVNSVPTRHVDTICKLFLIGQDFFINSDLASFMKDLENPGSSWEPLWQLAASAHNAVRLVLTEPDAAVVRGIGGIDDDSDAENRIYLNQKFRLEFDGPLGWHFLVLFLDPNGPQYLWPNPKNRENVIKHHVVMIPSAENKPLYATLPTGKHSLLVVLSREQWSDETYAALWDNGRRGYAIDQIYATLINPTRRQGKDWELSRLVFTVV